jgi:deazaflavin-dependent oxidoreductase (nitroreductase family)
MVVVERAQPPQAEHVIKEAAEAPARDRPGSEASTLRRRLDQLEDWLAGYPDTLPVRLLHRAPMLLWRLGLGRIEGDVVLTTTGRTSGLPRRIVIGPTRTDGRRYLWNPYGERAHWYRNLVADPIVTIQDRDSTWTARAVHPADHDEAVVLYADLGRDVGRRFHRYLAHLGVEDSPEGFARDIERIHVVRLDPVDEPGPAPQPADLAWVWPVAGLGALVGTIVARRLRLAVAGTAAVGAALAALRGRELIDRLAELTISRPAGPIGRMLYRDATSMHGEGWRICHQKLALKPRDRLLDVGCGGGTFLSQALQTVESAAGLDHSPDMVELTKASNAQAVAEGRLEVRLGDASALPWNDATFDAASNLAALFFATDPPAVLREAARVLKPGGRFVVVTVPKAERQDLGSRVMRWLLPKAKLFHDEELAELLTEAGFREVDVDSTGGEYRVGYGVAG